jgi:hypothetical protein
MYILIPVMPVALLCILPDTYCFHELLCAQFNHDFGFSSTCTVALLYPLFQFVIKCICYYFYIFLFSFFSALNLHLYAFLLCRIVLLLGVVFEYVIFLCCILEIQISFLFLEASSPD